MLAGLLLPILGALPDALIILVSGLGGTREEAQEQVMTPAVPMALLARVLPFAVVAARPADQGRIAAIDDYLRRLSNKQTVCCLKQAVLNCSGSSVGSLHQQLYAPHALRQIAVPQPPCMPLNAMWTGLFLQWRDACERSLRLCEPDAEAASCCSITPAAVMDSAP